MLEVVTVKSTSSPNLGEVVEAVRWVTRLGLYGGTLGEGVLLGDGEGEADGDGLGDGETLGEAEGEGLAEGEGDGLGDGFAATAP